MRYVERHDKEGCSGHCDAVALWQVVREEKEHRANCDIAGQINSNLLTFGHVAVMFHWNLIIKNCGRTNRSFLFLGWQLCRWIITTSDKLGRPIK